MAHTNLEFPMDVNTHLVDMAYGAGGIWHEDRTIEFLQYNWDRMRHLYPLATLSLPQEVTTEMARIATEHRPPYMDDLDFTLHTLTVAISAVGHQHDLRGLNTDGDKFLYYLRNWNGIMDAQWGAV